MPFQANLKPIGVISISLKKQILKAIMMLRAFSAQQLKEKRVTLNGHLEFLEAVGDPATGLPIGDTSLNLKAAIAGETHEYTDMYPGMARTAREEGFEEIADWFETLGKAERSHAGRFQRALETMS